MQYQIQL